MFRCIQAAAGMTVVREKNTVDFSFTHCFEGANRRMMIRQLFEMLYSEIRTYHMRMCTLCNNPDHRKYRLVIR